ncbi:lipopolysaccharide biosynthesis protein [Sphingomonas naphthae]|uniref:Lipopolysaccharide biosynthesis protein n=1 Tax=Sphingomonas naphthae TaxID=1813468 RepID=A0ABY7TRM1_9SPHN|nr:lipopolysaccharide biosynthesis protein [Sphingomonas naphthae]WCT74849.1 lipopolysaccharide biosynthesis protein [Sphingomonas naphthae]
MIAPTLLAACYFFLIASDQYEAETHIVVRSAEGPSNQQSSLSGLLGLAGGPSSSTTEALGVADYMSSHDAVAALRQQADLVRIFNRPGTDVFSRLGTDNPTPEKLLKFYNKQVKVELNRETGITTIVVRAFTPEDSYRIANMLLRLGDRRINSLNTKSYDDAIANSRRQLAEAEQALTAVQSRMSGFRERTRDIDPEGTGRAQTVLVTNLTQTLAQARAQLSSMGQLVSTSSPQYRALAARVNALAAQVAQQSGRLAGSGDTIASSVANYNELQLRQQFAAKRYEAAGVALQNARQQALRKQLYLVRVVEPNMPVKSTYPHRIRTTATVFVGLLIAFAIGWMIVAGVKEHSA